ncbi:hypothetical protein IH601_05765 [Candidatus Bipolaricaulota bacterium]|nr:hypothetical protein [Candidatus Bipolaricaulota bacterium]
MEYDKDRVDAMTLALMYLVMSETRNGGQAWKTFDVQTLKRLHEKGWIRDLKAKSATVEVTREGLEKAEELFREHFQGI